MEMQSAKVLADIATLKGSALDWAVNALIAKGKAFDGSHEQAFPSDLVPYSSDPVHANRLMQERMISCVFEITEAIAGFYAPESIPEPPHLAHAMSGETIFEAACRAFLARSHGSAVYVPSELLDNVK